MCNHGGVMAECNWQPDGELNRCPTCNATRPLGITPRRNCPASPDIPLSQLDRILNELDRADHFTHGPDRIDDEQLAHRITTCLACQNYAGHCNDDAQENAKRCKARRRWLLRLACNQGDPCKHWLPLTATIKEEVQGCRNTSLSPDTRRASAGPTQNSGTR